MPAPPPPTPSKPLFGRQRTKDLDQKIHARRSLRILASRADQLESGAGDTSSSESIAAFVLNHSQENFESLLRDQLRHHPSTFRSVIHLLRFSAYCSWRSSLICASLLKKIFDANAFITRIEIILQAPYSCHRQILDVLTCLGELQSLFPEETIDKIRHADLLLQELQDDLEAYAATARVRTAYRLRAFKSRTQHIFSCCACASDVQNSDIVRNHADGLGNSFRSTNDAVSGPRDMPGDESGTLSSGGKLSGRSTVSSLQLLDTQLHMVEVNVYCVIGTFRTLIPLLEGTNSRGLGRIFIDLLRNDPLVFDAISDQITHSHERLRRQLDDVRQLVLSCFTYINGTRDPIFSL